MLARPSKCLTARRSGGPRVVQSHLNHWIRCRGLSAYVPRCLERARWSTIFHVLGPLCGLVQITSPCGDVSSFVPTGPGGPWTGPDHLIFGQWSRWSTPFSRKGWTDGLPQVETSSREALQHGYSSQAARLTVNVPTNPGDNVAVNSWPTEGQRGLTAVDHTRVILVTSSLFVAGGGR